MSARKVATSQQPLPPFKKEIDAAYIARLERERERQQRNRELQRVRSARYRARKAGRA